MQNFMLNIVKLKDFAKLINTPESTVRTWKRRGHIPATCFIVIGSTVFVKVDEFQHWLAQVA